MLAASPCYEDAFFPVSKGLFCFGGGDYFFWEIGKDWVCGTGDWVWLTCEGAEGFLSCVWMKEDGFFIDSMVHNTILE